MQDLLTFLVEFIVIGFALIMAFDFIIGLFNLFVTVQRDLEPHSKLQTQLELQRHTQIDEKEQPNQYLDPDLELQPERELQRSTTNRVNPEQHRLLRRHTDNSKRVDPPTPPGGDLQERVAGGILPPAISRAERGGQRPVCQGNLSEPISELEPEPKPETKPESNRQTAQQLYLDLTLLKIYKLRGESVVRVDDVNVEIPDTVKRYKLRKLDVIKLKDLELLLS